MVIFTMELIKMKNYLKEKLIKLFKIKELKNYLNIILVLFYQMNLNYFCNPMIFVDLTQLKLNKNT